MSNRILKFRAWHKLKNIMLIADYSDWEDFFIEPDGSICQCIDTGGWEPTKYKEYRDRILEIMQFTGLKDKNGKEIYEGDIVKHWYEEAFFQGTVIGVVEYDHIGAAFFIDYPDNGFARSIQSYDLAYSEFEVIGNIYENPELLNVPSEKGE